MTSKTEFELKRKELMYEILSELSTWKENGIEEVQKILSTNDKKIREMQEIDKDLTKEQLIAYNVKNQALWTEIIQKQETLNQWIRLERQKTSEQLAQTGNKEKVVSSYIGLQKDSGLIGKNY